MRHAYRAIDTDPNRLVHHGIKGQKWGVRRFQNEDGTLTSAGKARNTSSVVAKRDPIKEQERLERTGAKTEGPSSRDMKRHQDMMDRYGVNGSYKTNREKYDTVSRNWSKTNGERYRFLLTQQKIIEDNRKKGETVDEEKASKIDKELKKMSDDYERTVVKAFTEMILNDGIDSVLKNTKR